MQCIRRFLRSGAAQIALCLICISLPAAADELADLLARHVEWRGGNAFINMQSLRQMGKLETGGLAGPEERLRSALGESEDRANLGLIKVEQIVGQHAGWELTRSGQVESLAEEVLQDVRHEAKLQFAGVLRSGSGAQLSLRADETYDEHPWRVVHVDFGRRDSYDLFLDAGSGALHGYRMVRNNETSFVRLGNWRVVAGVRLPFAIETLAPTPAGNATFRVSRAEVNPALPKRWLRRPVGEQKSHFANGARRTAWIPFEFPDNAQMFIPAEVNGISTQIMFDSGAEATVLDRDFAKSHGIEFAGAQSVSGTSGSDEIAFAKNVSIRLGGLTLRNLTVGVMPLNTLAKAMGHDLPVLLGKELLNEVVMDIDFQNRRIAFERSQDYTPPKASHAVDARIDSNHLRVVDISVEHGPAIPATFDLGNGGPMFLNATYWKSRKLDEGRPTSVKLSHGVGGQRVEPVVTLGSMKLGDMEFARVPSALVPEAPSGVSSDRTMANVGIGIWRQSRLIVDYAHDKLHLIPYGNTRDVSLDKDRSGLALRRSDDGFEVVAVAKSAPAARQGWVTGDRIASIDGHNATDPKLRRWTHAPAGTHVILGGVDAAGQAFTRELTLIDFF